MDVRSILENAFLRTEQKHGDFFIPKNLLYTTRKYINDVLEFKNPRQCSNNFCSIISRNDIRGNDLRATLIDYSNKMQVDYGLEFLDILYDFCISTIIATSEKYNNNKKLLSSVFSFINDYQTITNNRSLSTVKNQIYYNPMCLENFYNSIVYIIQEYAFQLLTKNGLCMNTFFRPIDETDYLRANFTNITKNGIMPSFSAIVVSGKIQVASDIGYKSKQDDAVLCRQKGGCSLSIVADGVSYGDKGNIASRYLIEEMNKWFTDLNLSKFALNYNREDYINIKDNYNYLSSLIEKKIEQISLNLYNKHKDELVRPLTTVVLAFVTPAYTLFMNVGDSTAYVYSKNKNIITSMSEIDNRFVEKSIRDNYEAYRRSPVNNYVTASIGDNTLHVHKKLMLNDEDKRIILSSDGVTDLINESNFANMLSQGQTADKFVLKAKNNPDLYGIGTGKNTDNISAIIINVDEFKKGKTR